LKQLPDCGITLNMIVMKFGGSSVASAERIATVAKIIATYTEKRPIIALSAMGDTTDYLLEAADRALAGVVDIERVKALHLDAIKELGIDVPELAPLLDSIETLLRGVSMLRELSKRTRDYLVSFGERLSVRIMAAWLRKQGIPARAMDAWDAGIFSDSAFMQAEPLASVWETIPKAFAEYQAGVDRQVPVVTGFIAKDAHGDITTLGRGGSDLTATLLGAALGAEEVQTWKDVDGILTADPRIVKDARLVPEVTYDEAAELAHFGAQVLHPRSMTPCRKTGTLVRVKNSYNMASPGTVITAEHKPKIAPVRVITMIKGVRLIDIVSSRMLGASGFLAHIFNQFLKWNISVDVVATSEVSVSLTVNTPEDLTGLLEDVGRVAAVECRTGKAIISVICDVRRSSAILADCFAALEAEHINVQMISQGASKVNISLICDDPEADRAIQALHRAFFG
jgi:aspartate kinase